MLYIDFMNKHHLQINHLDKKLAKFAPTVGLIVPSRGWINAIRTSIRMSLEQLGSRLGISKQAVNDLEDREASGSVTLRRLTEVANALDMEFVYGFVPRTGSIAGMVRGRTLDVARRIVERTSAGMSLEDQEVTRERLDSAIRDRAASLEEGLPRFLWD